MNKNIIQRVNQVGAIIVFVLMTSLLWRTTLQQLVVVSSKFENSTKYNICDKADGCVGFWPTTYRYEPAIQAWIPILQVAYPKTGKYNASAIKAKLKAEMDKEAEQGFILLNAARKRTEIQFTMDRNK